MLKINPINLTQQHLIIEETKLTTCPECDANLTVPADVMQGEIIACTDCGAELEVVTLNPVTLATAPEVQEDWGE